MYLDISVVYQALVVSLYGSAYLQHM